MATKEEILDGIAAMTVLELSELLKEFEDRFGVTAAAPVAVAAAPAGDGRLGRATLARQHFDRRRRGRGGGGCGRTRGRRRDHRIPR